VEISSEVQVDPVGRNHLGVTAAGGAALDAETRTKRRLAQGAGNRLSDMFEAVGQADGCRGFTFARGGGCGGGHQHQFWWVRSLARFCQCIQVHLVDFIAE
jgi:hypothetical protein